MKTKQPHKLSDLINAEKLHSIMATFYRLTCIGSSVIDLDGNIIVGDYATGWKRLCVEFHRKHPETLKKCIESDTSLCNRLLQGEKYVLYNCLNGMVDSAVPIMIKGEHVANLFSGQYFISPPDEAFFREQANSYGFNEYEYLSALKEVAVLPAERVKQGAQFLTDLAEMIGRMALSNREVIEINTHLKNRVQERTGELVQANQLLQSEISERKRAEEALSTANAVVAEERQRFNDVFETLPYYIILLTTDYHVSYANRVFRERFGESRGRQCYDYLFGRNEPCETCETFTVLKTGAPHHWEWLGPDGRNYDIFDFPFIERDGSRCILETGVDITVRKRAEDALRRASAYSRSLIEASLDPLVTISVEGKITDVNEATIKATGISRDKLIGTDFFDYFTEPDKARAGYQEAFAAGIVKDYFLSIRHTDGSVMDVSYNATVYRDDKGEVAGVFAAARDVTDVRQAEKKIKERMKELQAFYHLSAMAERKDLGLDDLYQDLANVLPESWQYPETACARIVAGEREFPTANFAVSPWMQAAPIKVFGAVIGGIEVGYLDYRQDADEGPFLKEERLLINAIAERVGHITERRRAEEELRSASLYARSLIEASPDPLVTISPEGKINDVNEATIRVTGIPRDKLIGTDFSNYFTESGKAREGYQQVFAKGSVADYPLTIRQKDGRLTDVLYNASVYRDARGRILGVFAAARDVTEQKQASQYARNLIEVSLDPLVTISPEGKITDVNEATIKATGVPRDKLLGTDFSNYFTEPGKAREGYQQVFAKGSVTDYPLTIRHKDGRLTDVLYNASVYRDVQGRVLGVFAAARDVTAQREAEAKVAEQRAREERQARELERLAELERFHKVTVGRELRMVELKKEIEELKRENETLKKEAA